MTTVKKLPARAEKGRSITKDGRFWMWRDSLYSNSGGYDPMKVKPLGGKTVVIPRKDGVGA